MLAVVAVVTDGSGAAWEGAGQCRCVWQWVGGDGRALAAYWPGRLMRGRCRSQAPPCPLLDVWVERGPDCLLPLPARPTSAAVPCSWRPTDHLHAAMVELVTGTVHTNAPAVMGCAVCRGGAAGGYAPTHVPSSMNVRLLAWPIIVGPLLSAAHSEGRANDRSAVERRGERSARPTRLPQGRPRPDRSRHCDLDPGELPP